MRIIAGKAKGRVFDAPKGISTRPTLDRVKEAMFGMVQFDVQDRRVLDLFAGSGNLGLEALSRGASHVVFCDADRSAAKLVEHNLCSLGFEGMGSVFSSDCFSLLDQLALRHDSFSLVLLDPPYASGLLERVISELVDRKLLKNNAIILAEHSRKKPIDANALCENARNNLEFREPRKYGEVGVTYIRYFGDER